MRRRRAISGVVAGLVAAASLATTQAASADGHLAAAVPELNYGPCPTEFGLPELPPSYACATVEVPLDHDEPDGDTIELGLVRREADDPSAKQGTIFVNPGGPSGSGVGIVAFAGEVLFGEQVEASFDIIGFDPRGVVSSTPLRCFDSEDEFFVEVAPPFPWPENAFEFFQQRLANRELQRACEGDAGPIIDHMSTAQVARDMDLLRQAVGDEQLNFVGYSYGSYVGNMYANLFPDTVGALVIDGILDPVDWATGTGVDGSKVPISARLDSDVGAQDTLDEFFRLCDAAAPDRCAFGPGSAERYAALFEQLDRSPLMVEDPVSGETFVVDDRNLVSFTLGPLYSSQAFSTLARDLAELEAVVAGLDGTTVGPGPARRLGHARELPPPYFGIEGFLGVICTDGTQPGSISAWDRAADESVGYFGPLWALGDVWCADWPGVDEDAYLGPFDNETANTVLVASTVYDPATAYSGALAVQEQLPNSALLTVNGWGHTTPGLSACADAITDTYLLTRAVPATEVVCDQDFDPFDIPPAPPPPPPPGDEPPPELGADLPSPRVPGLAERTGDETMAAAADAVRGAGDDELADRLERRAMLLEHITGRPPTR